VDVQVLDSQGQPLSALEAGHFDVTIDGKQRRVMTVNRTKHEGAVRSTPLPASPTVPPAMNDWPATGPVERTFMIVIDAGSFRPIEVRMAVQAARRLIAQLSPNDAVGLFVLPSGEGVVPSTDRRLLRSTLEGVQGRRGPLPTSFDLSVAEIVDLTAQAYRLRGTGTGSQLANSTPVEDESLSAVTLRECPADPRGQRACGEVIIAEAQALSLHLEEQVLRTLSGINSLLGLLRDYPGRKTVLVMSAGMPVSDRIGGRPNVGDEVRKLGEQAAYANATVYSLYIDPDTNGSYSVQKQRPRAPASGRQRNIQSKLLDDFALPTGGTLLRVETGFGDDQIDRVVLESSSYYLLGVEPIDTDRDGRPHRLRVRVNARNSVVRSRQWVVVPPVNR
jgi:VWFA-related protein